MRGGACVDEDACIVHEPCKAAADEEDVHETSDVVGDPLTSPVLPQVRALAAAFVLTGINLLVVERVLGCGGVNEGGDDEGGVGMAVEIRTPSVIQPCCTIHSKAGSRNVGATGLGAMFGTRRGNNSQLRCVLSDLRARSMRTTLT